MKSSWVQFPTDFQLTLLIAFRFFRFFLQLLVENSLFLSKQSQSYQYLLPFSKLKIMKNLQTRNNIPFNVGEIDRKCVG